MYIYIYIYMCVCVYMCVYMAPRQPVAYPLEQLRRCRRRRSPAADRAPRSDIYIYIYIYVYIYIYICVCVYICVCIWHLGSP